MTEITLLRYGDMLESIKGQNSHLLLGNGFNRGLGVNTGYKAILKKMTQNDYGIYKDAQKLVKESGYDLEIFIGKLTSDISPQNSFLKKYVENKVKCDFMKAAHEIVKAEIKNIYAKKNEGIFMLFKNFTNYFTLNYDSLLYLLLLNFKLENKVEADTTIALQASLKFQQDHIDEVHDNIYTEIKSARANGVVNINFGEDANAVSSFMGGLKKKNFISDVEVYSQANHKGWKTTDIDRVVKSILEEEKKNKILETVDDGSTLKTLFDGSKDFVFDANSATQNLFFLHGAFHIYRDGKEEKKITQASDKALYDKLEEILNSEEREILSVFQANNKTEEIAKSEYLKNALNKLSTLSGSLVIIGCSLSDNDAHVFDQIESSAIETIYISSRESSKARNYKQAKKFFKTKEVIFFDTNSISYELPSITQ